jgi:hypothetical protein
LIEVCCFVLDDLDGDHFLRLQILAFDNLPKSALTQHIEDEIPVPMKV